DLRLAALRDLAAREAPAHRAAYVDVVRLVAHAHGKERARDAAAIFVAGLERVRRQRDRIDGDARVRSPEPIHGEVEVERDDRTRLAAVDLRRLAVAEHHRQY